MIERIFYTCPLQREGHVAFVKGWVVQGNSGNPLVVVPDFGELCASYVEACEELARRGVSTYCFDLAGVGSDPRWMAHVANMTDLISDMLQVLAWVRHKHAGHASVVVGNGLICSVVAVMAARYPKFVAAGVGVAPVLTLYPTRWWVRWSLVVAYRLLPRVELPARMMPVLRPPCGSALGRRRLRLRASAKVLVELRRATEFLSTWLARSPRPRLVLGDSESHFLGWGELLGRRNKSSCRPGLELQPLEQLGHHPLVELAESRTRVVSAIVEWLMANQLLSPQPSELAPPSGTADARMPDVAGLTSCGNTAVQSPVDLTSMTSVDS